MKVSMKFARRFTCTKVEFDSISFYISEQSIAEATGLSTEGEKWFKRLPFQVDLKIFLRPGYENTDWSQGIPRNCLKEEWKQVLAIIQRYVTCEGRFETIYKYHMRFFLHVAGVSKLNLPFYLFKSLSKMSAKVKSHLDYTPIVYSIMV